MRLGWIKSIALLLGLPMLLAACQSGSDAHSTRSVSYAPAPSAYHTHSYYGCGYYPCRPRRICPPGYILARVPYAYGGPGRYCKPYYRRYCARPASPPPCGWHGPQPCQHGRVAAY